MTQAQPTKPTPIKVDETASPSFEQIIKLHNEGIVSKTEARSLALRLFPEKQNSPKKTLKTPKTPPHQKRKWKAERYQSFQPTASDIDSEINDHVVGPSRKKSRPGRASPQTAKIRHLVKDSTRRRFFNQCIKEDSVLWETKPGGKQLLKKLLFSRAAQDPMEECYRLNPGPLYSVPGSKLMKIIKWRVNKDRQNWAGKTPKRQVVFGADSPWDWEGNNADLERLEQERWHGGDATLQRSSSASSASSSFTVDSGSDSSADSSGLSESQASESQPHPEKNSESQQPHPEKNSESQPHPDNKKGAGAPPPPLGPPPPVKRKKIVIDCLSSCLTCGVACSLDWLT